MGMPQTRRQFLSSLAVALSAPAVLAATAPASRYPLSFSTLGCPSWPWRTVLDRAAEWGYMAIELRGLNGEMDLTKCPEFQGARLAASIKDLEALDLRICNLGASTRFHDVEPAVRKTQMDEGRRYVDLAHRLKAPMVRVFGDRIVGGAKEATVNRVIAGLRELGEHAKDSGVSIVIESHGDFCDSPTLQAILDSVNLPNVALLWDVHHTVAFGKERPAVTLEKLRSYIRHVHLKDSVPDKDGVRYVLTGKGTIPLGQIVHMLVKASYPGLFSLEWEKKWHPELPEPEIAFPQYAEIMRQYLASAGVKPS
jgi:sugar phosphate isomerase/epimerase